jgi:hypothetical protein
MTASSIAGDLPAIRKPPHSRPDFPHEASPLDTQAGVVGGGPWAAVNDGWL